METINFKELEIKNIDGTTQKVDIAKEMANVLYYSTNSIAAVSTALDIYKEDVLRSMQRQQSL